MLCVSLLQMPLAQFSSLATLNILQSKMGHVYWIFNYQLASTKLQCSDVWPPNIIQRFYKISVYKILLKITSTRYESMESRPFLELPHPFDSKVDLKPNLIDLNSLFQSFFFFFFKVLQSLLGVSLFQLPCRRDQSARQMSHLPSQAEAAHYM